MAAMAGHVRAMLVLKDRGAVTFDYGNKHPRAGASDRRGHAFDSRLRPEYIRPLFCEGKGPFRWAACRAIRKDIRVTDEAAARDVSAHNEALVRWIRLARERVAFQGLPARILWLGYGERARFGAPHQRARP